MNYISAPSLPGGKFPRLERLKLIGFNAVHGRKDELKPERGECKRQRANEDGAMDCSCLAPASLLKQESGK